MSEEADHLLATLGFRCGVNGPHAARTMMLDDLRALFSHVPATAEKSQYVEAILATNVLGKPTKKARELAARHLGVLYVLALTEN